MEIYKDIALYLYENNLMEKPNIQSFGRWCMDYICNTYRPAVIHLNMMKQQQQRKADATTSSFVVPRILYR
jgi:hypothetical protein